MTGPRVWLVAVWALAGIAILCGLGAWQLSRLSEKEQQLAEIARRMNEPPVTLSEALRRRERQDDVEFLKVKATGFFNHARELHKLTTFDGKPGWQIITPFQTTEGIVALVDRGVAPDELRDVSRRPEPPAVTQLTGIIRAHAAERAFFDPDNDARANSWYWWDVPSMLSAVSIPGHLQVAPFIVQALPGSDPKAFPRASPPTATLANNHLQYALTWFALAAALLAISAVFIGRLVRKAYT